MTEGFVSLSPCAQRTQGTRARSAVQMLGAAAIGLMTGFASPFDHSNAAQAEDRPFRQMCALWDAHASDAIVRRVEESHRHSDLIQVSDAISRMRRARRNCDNGWITSACVDYHAIVHSLPGTRVVWAEEVPCPLALSEELRTRMREALNVAD